MRFYVLLAIGLVLFGFLARPLILNQVPIEYDLGRYHLPLRDFYQRCLHNGDDPAWCPQLLCGYDLHGEGQAGMDHPWHRLLYSCLPLTVAFNIEVFANYPFLCLGTYFFLRRQRLPRDAELAGALTATFGGFTLPHYSHTNAIAIVAHMPWLLWLTDVLWHEKNPRRKAIAGASIAMLTGSQILLGYPQYVYFSCIAEGVYVLCLLSQKPLVSRRFAASSLRPLALWTMLKSLGIAIGGAQLLPSLQALSLSPRLGYDAAFRGMLSLPWEMLLQLVAPTQFNVGTQLHEYTVYCGALATLGTVWWLMIGWSGGKSVLNRFAFWLIVIAVPLALGRHTPLFQVYLKLPIVGVFRCPCRYLVLSHFAAAIVVARLVQQLDEASTVPWRRLVWLLLVPASAWMLFIATWDQFVSDEATKFLAPGAGYLGAINLSAATLLIIVSARGYKWAIPLLLMVGFADLGIWGFRSIFGTRDTPVHMFVDLETFNASQKRPPGEPNGRVQIGEIYGNALMMTGWSLTSGYVGLSPPRSLNYNDEASQIAAGTTWWFRDDQWQSLAGLPRLRWDDHTNSGIKLMTDRPGHIELMTHSIAPRKLIVAESFHPEWQATIDGRVVDVSPADGDFQSCMVPAGPHRVIFHFTAARRTWGRYLSVAGLITVIILSLWMARSRGSNMIQSRGEL
jgi:hypothetical protein